MCLAAIVRITVFIGSASRLTSLKYLPGPTSLMVVFEWATTSSGIACIVAK